MKITFNNKPEFKTLEDLNPGDVFILYDRSELLFIKINEYIRLDDSDYADIYNCFNFSLKKPEYVRPEQRVIPKEVEIIVK